MAMNLPLYMHDAFGYPVAMALATVLGMGFGFTLERAGFGRATTLAAQFYGGDNRVLKVMFSAIVTAAVGLGLFAGLGWLDLAALRIPETFIWPHLVGGILLGVGFVVSGYCPGTAVVAAGSGRIDGLFALLGIMAGSVLFGVLFPWLQGFYVSGALGVVTLPALLGLPWVVVAMGVVLMAVGAFYGAEALERWVARRRHEPGPAAAPRLRNRVFWGLGLATAAGLATLLWPPHEGRAAVPAPAKLITPLELAQRLAAGTAPTYLVDLRPTATCQAKRIPGALCLPASDASGAFIGGLEPTGAQLHAYRLRAALHAHFTTSGAPAAVITVRPKAVKRVLKKGGGC